MKRLLTLLMVILFCALAGCSSSQENGLEGFLSGNGGSLKVPTYSDASDITVPQMDIQENTVPETSEPPDEPTVPQAEIGGKILQTKYFNVVMPNSWVGRYYAEIPENSGYLDYDRKNFHYEVSLYEKEGYSRGGGQGYLLDIILTSDPYFSAFANGRRIGEMVSDSQYYFFVRYPTDIRFDMDTQKNYYEMQNHIKEVLEGIYSDTYSVTIYSDDYYDGYDYYEEPQADYSDYIFPDSAVRLLTEQEIRSTLSGMWAESPSGSYVQDAINEIYARNGYVFQNQALYAYYLRQSWYQPDSNFSAADLSQIEKANIALLQTFLAS